MFCTAIALVFLTTQIMNEACATRAPVGYAGLTPIPAELVDELISLPLYLGGSGMSDPVGVRAAHDAVEFAADRARHALD